jgi:hypothetical protein
MGGGAGSRRGDTDVTSAIEEVGMPVKKKATKSKAKKKAPAKKKKASKKK